MRQQMKLHRQIEAPRYRRPPNGVGHPKSEALPKFLLHNQRALEFAGRLNRKYPGLFLVRN
jgi:hypothetical protein